MLSKQIFEIEISKLLVKNPSEKYVGVGRVSLFRFLFAFDVTVVVVCLFFLVDFYF